MAEWEGKSRGNKTGYGIFIAVLKKMGVLPAYILLLFVAAYYFLFSWKSSRSIWYYLRKRLGFPVLKSLLSLYQNYYWFGQALIDRIVMMAGIPNRFTFNFDGEQHLHEMVAAGKGGLLLSAHIGNWEIAGHLLRRLNTRINIVMFDGEHQQLKQYLENTTGKRNANIIVIKDNISHIYEIMEALNNNELVCMHSDRFLPGNKTLKADFLGKRAYFPQGPFALATKLNVPVTFVFAMKESFFHYHFFAAPPVVYRTQPGISSEKVLEAFVDAMTEKVKSYPAQWYNYYDFWK
ncbi:lipid A biosynthesis acyltransferase [Niabella yanshanensis]|uniref:Lipid A biosynthesis acyltransferase n=1 Tax=Niabella yanshanensis TaxID=577386 RepID=A0ABZ0W1Z2_9BACT|nr:lipid A biosynthesis acyltransferase [Niabella yanshanensis]WQD36724.1 lipid A biosynthesis acyltransferase [Niabella yanshanensis]